MATINNDIISSDSFNVLRTNHPQLCYQTVIGAKVTAIFEKNIIMILALAALTLPVFFLAWPIAVAIIYRHAGIEHDEELAQEKLTFIQGLSRALSVASLKAKNASANQKLFLLQDASLIIRVPEDEPRPTIIDSSKKTNEDKPKSALDIYNDFITIPIQFPEAIFYKGVQAVDLINLAFIFQKSSLSTDKDPILNWEELIKLKDGIKEVTKITNIFKATCHETNLPPADYSLPLTGDSAITLLGALLEKKNAYKRYKVWCITVPQFDKGMNPTNTKTSAKILQSITRDHGISLESLNQLTLRLINKADNSTNPNSEVSHNLLVDVEIDRWRLKILNILEQCKTQDGEARLMSQKFEEHIVDLTDSNHLGELCTGLARMDAELISEVRSLRDASIEAALKKKPRWG